MSVWQYMAALEGHMQANGAEGSGKLSSSDKDRLWSKIQGSA